MMNCIFDCEYCYLKGMYPSGNLVVFVNLEDIFAELEALLAQKSIYLCVSYDADLVAIESLTGFVREWIAFTKSMIILQLKSAPRVAGVICGAITKPVTG